MGARAVTNALKDPLVIIPGFMADARAFLPQIVGFATERPVTVLMPKGGETSEQISESLMAALPERSIVMGHGFGGTIALDILRRAPEKISRLILISTDPLAESPVTAGNREARIIQARTGRLSAALSEEFPAKILADTPWRHEILDLIYEMGLMMGVEAYIAQVRLMQRRPDQQRTLRRVRIPALILAGEKDSLVTPRRQELMLSSMPYAQMQVIPEAGHMPQLEQPEAVNLILSDFMNLAQKADPRANVTSALITEP